MFALAAFPVTFDLKTTVATMNKDFAIDFVAGGISGMSCNEAIARIRHLACRFQRMRSEKSNV